jgi:hypothetical protein
VRSLKHHRWPFDIKQELVFSELVSDADLGTFSEGAKDVGTGTHVGVKALFTFYEGCWMNSYSASYTSDAAIVAENSSVTVTDIIDGSSPYGEYIDASTLSPFSGGGTGAGYSLRFASGSNQTSLGLV